MLGSKLTGLRARSLLFAAVVVAGLASGSGSSLALSASEPSGMPVATTAREDGRRPAATLAARGPGRTPALVPASRDFGTVAVALDHVTRAAFTLRAASRPLVVRPRLSNRRDFTVLGGCPNVLRARGSCALRVAFAPQTSGRRKATLTIPHRGRPALVARLTGTGTMAPPALTPNTHDFGNVGVGGRSAAVSFTLAAGSLPLATWSIHSTSPDFEVGEPACPRPLRPGVRCSIAVTFAPSGEGRRAATLTAATGTVVVLSASLTGHGGGNPFGSPPGRLDPRPQPPPSGGAVFGVGPNALDFGSAPVGTGSTKIVVVTGHGPGSIRVAEISLRGAPDFAVTDTCDAVLGAGSSCLVRVKFTAASPVGRKTGGLTIASDSGRSVGVALTGTALAGP